MTEEQKGNAGNVIEPLHVPKDKMVLWLARDPERKFEPDGQYNVFTKQPFLQKFAPSWGSEPATTRWTTLGGLAIEVPEASLTFPLVPSGGPIKVGLIQTEILPLDAIATLKQSLEIALRRLSTQTERIKELESALEDAKR